MAAAVTKITVPQSVEDITPSWVQQVLQIDIPGVTITTVDVEGSVSPQGQGYMTEITAFTASGSRNMKSERYSLVAKMSEFSRLTALIGDSMPDDFLLGAEIKEVSFYSTVVPELMSVLDQHTEVKLKSKSKNYEKGHASDVLLIPRCYFAATDPKTKMSVRIMENLKTQGFSTRSKLFGRDEMMLVVRALARIHGLSHRLELQSGVPILEKYNGILKPEDLRSSLEQVKHVYQQCVKRFGATFPDQADLAARLEKVDLEAMFVGYFENAAGRLRVLSHGDCWRNNIMFKYEQTVPIDVKIVDWQTAMNLPPTCDLADLFLSCADWDTFHNHRDAILAHYLHELQSVLDPTESRGLQQYTLDDLKADFKTDCIHGLFVGLTHTIGLPDIEPDLLCILQEIQEWGVI